MNEYTFEVLFLYGTTEEITVTAPSRFVAEMILIETYENIRYIKNNIL